MQHASTRSLAARQTSFVLRPMLQLWLSFSLVVALVALPRHTRADAGTSGLVLVVEDERITASDLHKALARELGIRMDEAIERDAARPNLLVSPLSSGRVLVALERPGKPPMERSASLPEAPHERAETVALVAENLLRGEAEELLDALQREAESASTHTPKASRDEPPTRPRAARSACSAPVTHAFGVDLFPAIGMGSTREGREAVRAFSLGLFGSYTRGVRGFSFSSFVNIQWESLCGVQLSGGFNVVAGQSQGLQLSLANYVGQDARGATLGLLNYVGGSRGLSLGLTNIVLGDISGLVLSLLNITEGTTRGATVGLANIATSDVHGAQLGLSNITDSGLQGLQAGLLNIAAGTVHGAQLGLVNVAGRESQGLQLGLINVAGSGQTPIGMISIVRKGRTDLDIMGPSESGLMFAGVRHGGNRVHNLYYVGARVGSEGVRPALGLGIGVRALETKRLRLDVDALTQHFYRMHADAPSYQLGVRAPLTIMVASRVGIVVAPSYQFYFSSDDKERSQARFAVSKLKNTSSLRIEGFPGVAVGMRFELGSSAPRPRLH